MRYDLDHWSRHTWQKDQRYYIVEIEQDLFGQWVCRRRWGSRLNRRGNNKTTIVEDYAGAIAQLAAVAKRRKHRGYVLQP